MSVICRDVGVAFEYCRYMAGGDCQRRLYFDAGGQPGHRAAWRDDEVNRRCHDYFKKTLQTLDEAWMRPRWNWYCEYQDEAANVVNEYAWHGGDARAAALRLNERAVKMLGAQKVGGAA